MKKLIRVCLEAFLLITSIIYPGCMAMLSAAGWRYNMKQGNYPEVFGRYSFWLFLGAGMILIGVISSYIGKNSKFYRLNYLAVGLDIPGMVICMIILHQFCEYADQHFSGIGEEMKPVSELYQERLYPIMLPGLLVILLSIWNFMANREDWIRMKNQQYAETPKIIEED